MEKAKRYSSECNKPERRYKYANTFHAICTVYSLYSKASIDFDKEGVVLESPVVYFGEGREGLLKRLSDYGPRLRKARERW
jgi:hypothetical protein